MLNLLCGMIASGKSTHATELAKNNWIIVNDDSIVNALHANNYTLYNKRLKPLYKLIENTMINGAVLMNIDVAIDRTCLSKSMRSRYIALANTLDVPIICTVFPIEHPEVHAHRRCNHDNRGYSYEHWLKVARSHLATYEQPSLSEGFQKIINLKDI